MFSSSLFFQEMKNGFLFRQSGDTSAKQRKEGQEEGAGFFRNHSAQGGSTGQLRRVPPRPAMLILADASLWTQNQTGHPQGLLFE
jgi:hypothetical protein